MRTEKLVFKAELASKVASEMMVTHGVVTPLVPPKSQVSNAMVSSEVSKESTVNATLVNADVNAQTTAFVAGCNTASVTAGVTENRRFSDFKLGVAIVIGSEQFPRRS